MGAARPTGREDRDSSGLRGAASARGTTARGGSQSGLRRPWRSASSASLHGISVAAKPLPEVSTMYACGVN